MQILSMVEFKELCEENALDAFVFDSSNQPDGDTEKLKLIMKFSEVALMLNPNRIAFKNEQGMLCLNMVKFIRYHDEASNVVKTFDIVCDDMTGGDLDMTYVITAYKMNV